MATPEAPLREVLKSISFTQLPLRHIEPFFEAEKITAPRLYIYKRPKPAEDQGLPTYDVECLRLLALLKFANYGFDQVYTNEPDGSPNGKLPYLLLPNGQAIDCDGIMAHLENSGHKLPESSLASELAYCTMIKHSLVPAIEYLTWVDSAGFEAIGQNRYLREYPMVVQTILGWFKSNDIAHDIQARQPEYGAALDGEVVCENAQRTFDSLLTLLGDREYFADTPGLLDAWAFACLNILIEAPVSSPIRALLLGRNSKYQPLVDYALRIMEKYF
ncbi:hypothetical protein IWW36_000947 [Coemansia brasiliensis]|uniref:Glutathione S-transferase n=1 Tax=Coemansia brasiliensis TaxID=2650707 RepID=A0A9W8LZH7_9FUNG|nr:hypothetical protein IWW36_000947 [Coemansia brasiliensis]